MPSVSNRQRPTVGGWAITAGLTITAVVLWSVRFAVLPFVIAATLALITDPAIIWVQKRTGNRRWVGGLLLYIAALLVIAGLGYGIGTTLVTEVSKLVQQGPQLIAKFLHGVVGNGISLMGKQYTAQDIENMAFSAAAGFLGGNLLMHVAIAGAGLVFGTFLTLVLIPYFMISGPKIAAGTVRLLPPERRDFGRTLLARIAPALRRYLIGVFLVVTYTAVIAWIAFGPVFHLPRSLLLAVTVGVLEIIPGAGPMTSIALVSFTALEQKSMMETAGLIAFIIVLRLSIDNVVGPFLLGQAARVHPVVVMFSFVIGAVLFGLIGLLLAVPVAVVIRMVLEQYYSEPVIGRGGARLY